MDEKGPRQEKEPELNTEAGKSYGWGLHGEDIVNASRKDGLIKINLGSRLSYAGENAKYRPN